MNTTSELIERAIAEARGGNKAEAMKILARVVRQEPDNAQAWYLLSRLVEEREQIIYCLERVLKIIPDDPQAKARLKKLQEPPPAVEPISSPPQEKNKPWMFILISAAVLSVAGMFMLAVFLGIAALHSHRLPIAFLQVLPQKIPATQPMQSLTSTPELKPSETIPPTPPSTATLTPTLSPSPSPTSTSLPTVGGVAACIPAGTLVEAGKVTGVIDGDTIEVLMNGQTYRVRYIGIDSPEVYDPATVSEPLGAEAAAKNKEFVDGKEILLVKDVSETDPFGRLLRYVFVGGLSGIFVNYEMVLSGYAAASSYPPDVACDEAFLSAEGIARSKETGLWAPASALIPTVIPVGERSGNCVSAYPDVCIPPPPPDLDCKDIPFRRFRVLPPDPHNFDRDQDGVGCES